jgi:hypothetical protein
VPLLPPQPRGGGPAREESLPGHDNPLELEEEVEHPGRVGGDDPLRLDGQGPFDDPQSLLEVRQH